MARIEYSPASIDDLEQIGDHIANVLKNPSAALNTVNKIQDSIDRLTDFTLLGAPLSSIVKIDTDYRFLVCANYIVFYHAREDSAYIDRILYGKRDYIAILFRDVTDSI